MLTVSVWANGQKDDSAGSNSGFKKMSISLQSSGIDSVPFGQAYVKFKQIVEEKTDGRVTVDLFWSSSLFSQDQTGQAVISGNLDMANTQSSFATDYVSEFSMLSSAYMFRNRDHWTRFYQSDIAKDLFDKLAAKGIRVLGACNLGSRAVNLTEDKKVSSRADLAGVKFREPNSDVWLLMGQALGGNAVGIPYSDLYVSLQTGVVDGEENPVANIKEVSLYEVTKSITMTQHMFSTEWLTISEKKWQSMSPELQQIVQDAATEAMDFATAEYLAQEEATKAFLRDKGLTIYELTDEELESYAKEVTDYYFNNEKATAGWDLDLYKRIQEL